MPRKIDPSNIKIGSGLAGTDSVDVNALTNPQSGGIDAHVGGGVPHEASSVSIDAYPPLYNSNNVEGALDELAALIPPRPPSLGKYSTLLTLSGIPDWGELKLRDFDISSITTPNPNPGSELYPYYHVTPVSADDNPPFTTPGLDPVTDPTFNVGDGIYTGGGDGVSHAGGYTRSGALIQTNRIFLDMTHAIVSGAVYPADRGVLALIYWGAGGTSADFLANTLDDRIIAAILLGQGIDGQAVGGPCDGEPGGIFEVGDTGGAYDPFAFPGQASGQYDLAEIHTGTSVTGGTAPAADTAAGQVRLGIDPNAGPLVVNGLRVLGATTVADAGGDDNNFFGYRLPYLSDYSSTTGLVYTSATEKPRYFTKPTISLDPGIDLTQAGDFPNFPKDYWSFQVARFRHRFEIPNGSGATTLDIGNFVLIHFKTEAAFETFALTGNAPAAGDLYSADLVDWANVENTTNLASASGITGSGYHVLRGALAQDAAGVTAVTLDPGPLNEFDYTSIVDDVNIISGVKYFVPRASGADGLENFHVNNLDLSIVGMWDATYRTSDDTYLQDQNPALLSASHFSFESPSGVPSHTPVPAVGFVGNANKIRHQRLEFALTDLSGGAPTPANKGLASLAPDIWEFLGDIDEPSFSSDGKIRLFVRKPIRNETLGFNTYFFYYGLIIPPTDGKRVLYHSSKNELSDTPIYGNFLTGGSPYSSLSTAQKDIEERFLDESYRYLRTWTGVPATPLAQLTGPGLPSTPAPIEVPVRAATTADPDFTSASWLQNNHHLSDLSTAPAVAGEAQITGVPDRNPLLLFRAKNPRPSAGLLYYPQENYTVGYRPSFADGDLTVAQFDYSGITGDVEYVRAFDASINQTVVASGQSFFHIRIKGLALSDFAYSAPGPGSTAIAIFVKVPGLTTWMDLGRVDGSGPSKQDVAVDGAGCQVVGPETFEDIDNDDRYTYSQVKVHTGPSAKLFTTSTGPEAGFAPILVKVIIKDTAGGKALNLDDGSPDSDPSSIRGLVGIEIIDPMV